MAPPNLWFSARSSFGPQRNQLLLLVCLLAECVVVRSGLASDIPDARCGSQRFGKACDIVCHCEEGCLSDGQCQGSKGCVVGYFGPGCQYVDLFVHHNINNPPYIADIDHSTCNPDESSRQLMIVLNGSFHFYWLVLHLSVTDLFSNTLVRLNGIPNTCFVKKVLTINNTIHIFCSSDVLVSKLEILGFVVQHICSVEISGGRDVTYLSHRTRTNPQAVTMDSDNCTIKETDLVNNELNLVFKGNVVLYRVQIYRRQNHTHQGFILRVLSQLDEELDVHSINGSLQLTESIAIRTFEPISVVNIRPLNDVDVGDSFQVLCRVETFGDLICPVNTYGLECEQTCSCVDPDYCQLPTGMCDEACPPGFYGDNCKHECPAKCLESTCQRSSGNCFHCEAGYTGTRCEDECPINTYGHKCESTCNAFCTIGSCDKISGDCSSCSHAHVGSRCEECLSGRYGPVCSQNCSTSCANSTCHAVSGQCLDCKDGHIGDNCTDCPPGKYGNLCSEACPDNCAGSICYPDSGNCLTCSEGYVGVTCQVSGIHEAASDPSWLYGSILAAAFVLSVGFVFFLRKRKPLHIPNTET